MLSESERENPNMNSGTYIVQNLRSPNMGTPDLQTMYKDSANRILKLILHVLDSQFLMAFVSNKTNQEENNV